MIRNLGFFHGGDIYSLLIEGKRYEDIIDFSASVNPLGPPQAVQEVLKGSLKRIVNYPDPHARELKKAIADYHNIEQSTIIPANGSTEVIYLTVRALRPSEVLIPVPTFSEYERASKVAGYPLKISYYELKEKDNFSLDRGSFIAELKNLRPFSMVFLCNPNNPTGVLLKREEVLEIAEACREFRVYLLVDEAFIDFTPRESVIDKVSENPCLIVLRSMTKFYGLAGLRLGYGVFHEEIVERILFYKEPWTVNTLAQIAGILSLRDRDFKNLTLKKMEEWKKQIEDLFRQKGIHYLPSSANFYLFKAPFHLAGLLRNKAILIRECSDFRGLEHSHGYAWFRIAVRRPEENKRLFKELRSLKNFTE